VTLDQACGAQQVVTDSAGMAKHGYMVAGFGYFAGVCQGSKREPLEISRAYLDATVVALGEYAERADKAAADYLSGASFPSKVAKRGSTGNREYAKGYYQGRRWVEGKAIMVEWAAANEAERAGGLEEAIYDEQTAASRARSHISSLISLAKRVHGQPLKARSFEKVAKVAPARLDVAAVIATGACPSAFKTKAARKDALESVSRQFDKLARSIRDLALGGVTPEARSEAATALYYSIPHQLNNWRPKHAAATLALYPQAAPILEEIQKCVAAREAIKAAP